jgi:hypothetical protein
MLKLQNQFLWKIVEQQNVDNDISQKIFSKS